MRTSGWWTVARRGLGSCLLALLCLGLAGCGGQKGAVELAKVTGKVTQDGQPLVAAEVMFIPKGAGAPSGGRTDENGRFEVRFSDGRSGAVPGLHGVVITGATPEVAPPMGGEQAPPTPPKEPLEFRTEAEVKAAVDNDFNFEVAAKTADSGPRR